MLKHKLGHVVNVASMAGQSGTNKLVDYCSSKFAAVGLDEAFRAELFVQGHSDYIKTTVVCPYYISTGMFAGVQVFCCFQNNDIFFLYFLRANSFQS